MKKILILLSLLISTPCISEESFNIGAILPLSGDASFWGVNPRKALELAQKDSKDSSIKIHFEDDGCDPKKAVAAFHKLTDINNAQIILGPACSSCSLAIAPLAAKKNVILIVFSEADTLSNIQNVFRLWAPNGNQAKVIAKYATKYKNIATLSVENAFGNDLTNIFKSGVNLLNRHKVTSESYLAENSGDLKTQIIKLLSKKPDALFFASYIKDGTQLVKQVRQFNKSIPLLGPSTINSPDFFSQLGPLANGIVFSDVPDLSTQEFRTRWEDEFKEPWPGMQSGGSLFYDIFNILLKAKKEGALSPTSFHVFLKELKSFYGQSGHLEFNEKGDLKLDHSLYRIQDEKVQIME